MNPAVQAVGAQRPTTPADRIEDRRRTEAMRGFEQIFVRQLVAVLRESVPSTESGGGANYMQLFDDALAESISSGNGIGLSRVLAPAFGVPASSAPLDSPGIGTTRRATMPFGFAPRTLPSAPVGASALAKAARETIGVDGTQWSREGSLGPADLASTLAAPARDGNDAHFNVLDANGYAGFYKCNLFALEVARRAGYAVPVVGRIRGFGFPDPDRLVRDAEDGALANRWGDVVTTATESTLRDLARRDDRALLVVGSGTEGRAGHVGVVANVRKIERDAHGDVVRFVYDGWEARPHGAEYIEARTWNRYGNPGGTNARNGFGRIEILALQRAADPNQPELTLSEPAHGSLRDLPQARPGTADDRTRRLR